MIGLFAAGGALLFGLFLLPVDFDPAEPRVTVVAMTSGTPPAGDRAGGKTQAPLTPADVDDASLDTAIELYEQWAQYPPDSRPLHEAQWDVIEPNVTPSAPRRLVRQTAGGEWRASDYECTLQAQRHTVAEGQSQLITLLCSTVPGDDVANAPPVVVAPEIKSTEMVLHWPRGDKPIERVLRFNDQGLDGDELAGDRVYSMLFTPSVGEWGEIGVTVSLSIPEEGSWQRYQLRTTFVASPAAPAKFTGTVVDRIEAGSLIVDVALDVKKPGRYRVFGNLKSADRYIAYAKQDVVLAVGMQHVSLRFFGKLLHDMGAQDGTFTVVDIRGHRLNLAEVLSQQIEPEIEGIPPFAGEFVTQPYKLSMFSRDVWDSLEKRRRLQDLQLAAQAESGE